MQLQTITMDLMIKDGEVENVGVEELLQAQELAWNHTFRFISSFSLKCAVQLEIPDVIYSHGKPMTISELASALSIHPSKHRALYRLMRILVQSGFFEERKVSIQDDDNEAKGYVLALASRLLLKDNPFSARPLFLAMLDPLFIKPHQSIGDWFQNDDDPTPFATAYGVDYWEYVPHEPRSNHLYNEAMACDGLLTANVLVNKYKEVFEGLNSMVDVGGGMGILTKALAKTFPDMDFTVLDLPHVVDGLQGSENVKFVGGNMFDHVPSADAVMLKWIMHDWGHEDCVKILKKCKEAIIGSKDKGGKVMIIDIVMRRTEEDKQLIETKLFFDIHMMVNHKSQERNEQEWSQLFLHAGFNNYKINHILGVRSLIELFP